MCGRFTILNRVLLLVFILTSFTIFSQVTIASQNFDALPTGLGYTVSSSTYVNLNTYSESSPNSLRFSNANGTNDRDSDVIFNNVDISSFSNVTVTISFASEGVDNGENLYLDISYNGGGYSQVAKLIDGQNNGGGETWNWGTPDNDGGAVSTNPYTFSIPNGNTSIRVRVRATSLDNNEFFYIDNLLIRGDKYCASSGYEPDSYTDVIRLVNFNTINNASLNEDVGYSDFTSISTTVAQNSTYNLSVNINTVGTWSYSYQVWAWIDWNQDGDFNDAQESFDLGSANGVSNGPPSLSPIPITVPNFAVLGNTRMRVTTSYRYDPSPCDYNNFYGEVEDYTINVTPVVPTITTGSISTTTYCSGSSVNVPFTISGTYNSGNIFTAQLSDASGSFTSPITIGTLTSTAAGTIAATIPTGTASGAGYRIRVISSNPATNGSDNGINITINTTPTAPLVGTITQPTCALSTGSVVLNGLPSVPWTLTRSPGNVITTGTGTSSTITGLNPGTYTYTVNNSGLKAEYFNNMSLTGSPALTRTDATVNFDWGTGNPGAPISNDVFSVRWSGQIQPLYSENYTFTTRSDDGIRLWVNGVQIINNWTIHAPTTNTGSIALLGGQKYDIVLEYYENTGGAVAQLSWSSASQTNQIIPQSQLFPSKCISAASANIVINSIPSPPAGPSTTGALVCIGSTATLSTSGAVAGSVYKWYDAATLGTLLKTSTNNADNTYVTPVLASTTNYWVSILNASGCESARTIVTANFPANSTDSQTAAGTDSWIGHVYDGTNSGVAYNGNFTNYYGSITKAETFDESFGGNTTCYAVNSTAPLESRSIYTETFSIRYRMNSTKKGLYVVDLGSDDGSRLQVDGTLIYSEWSDHGFNSRPRVLMSLTGSSNLVYDFYENGGGNRVIFNNLVRVIQNNLNTNTVQNICALSTGAAISGDTFGSLPTGISLSGTGYQWAYSTSAAGPWTNISGATAATYTPTGSVAPFNAGGTFYFIRKAILSSSNNVNPNPYVATNNSNVATVNFSNSNTWTGAINKNWNVAGNWSCGTVPTISTNVLIPSGVTNYPEIYNMDAAGLSNNIELETGTSLIIFDNYINIDGNLLLNGIIDLDGEGQLLQTVTSTVDNASTGYIQRDQQGQGNKYRYNDWSSPVIKTGSALGTTFTVADVLRDGTDPANPKVINFVGGYDGNIAVGMSAIKIANYWIYKYANSPTNDYSAWQQIGSTGPLNPGEGFLMKGTGAPGSPDQNYVFEGKPNNGTIGLSVAGNYDYLVGNPYPSAIDGFQFLLDNSPSGTGAIGGGGAIYFWEHYGGNSHNLRDYQAGYATLTLSGGVPATAGALAGVSSSGTPVKTPGRYIPIGQGFFVVGDADGGTIEFNNGQRVFVTEANPIHSIFMKGVAQKTTKESNVLVSDTRPKFRLGFSGAKIDHRQILFTVDEHTTDGVDWGYEAEIYESFEDDMFWTIDDKKYVIQASNSVDINKEIPLGITSSGGSIVINIDALENVDDSTDLFIKDSLTGILHAIKNQSFEIDLPKGAYLNRFSFVFKTPIALEPEEPAEEILSDGIQVFMDNSIKELQIRKLGTEEIETVVLYNSLGQMSGYWKNDFLGDSFSLPVKAASGIYFVQIHTKNGKISKKVLVE